MQYAGLAVNRTDLYIESNNILHPITGIDPLLVCPSGYLQNVKQKKKITYVLRSIRRV